MDHVFLSYARQDREFAQELSKKLQDVGISVWVDREQIRAGQNWQDEIEKALQNAAFVIFISSQNSIASDFVTRELSEALRKQTPIIPIVVDDEGSSKMPASLYGIQWLDFRTNYKAAFQRLMVTLPNSVRHGQAAQQQKPKSKGYVFISYAQEDTEFVIQLRNFLKDRGYGYWDYQDSDRDYHTQLANELEGIIRGSAATLSVLSPDWKESKWAAKEYVFSEAVGTPVFLLMAREMGPTLVIAGIPYIDFTRGHDTGFTKLDKELRRKGLIE